MPHNSFPDRDWDLSDAVGNIQWVQVPVAVLMDIRRELKQLNALLSCPNFTAIPYTLRCIRRNTANKKPIKRKKAGS